MLMQEQALRRQQAQQGASMPAYVQGFRLPFRMHERRLLLLRRSRPALREPTGHDSWEHAQHGAWRGQAPRVEAGTAAPGHHAGPRAARGDGKEPSSPGGGNGHGGD